MASISIRCPSCSATEGVVRNGKSTAGHQRYLCSHCRKTWQLQFTYTASQPGTHQKIIDMAMNGVGCRASARIMGVSLNTVLRHLKNSGQFRICFPASGVQPPGNTRYSGVISKISAIYCVTPLPRDRPLTTLKGRFAYSLTVVHFRKLRYK